MEYINNIVTSSLVQFIIIIITVLAFVITILSYFKIKKVKEAQLLYQKYVDLDNLINILEIAKQYIEVKHINETDMLLKKEDVIENITKQIATIESVNKVLFYKNKLDYKSNVIFHANGYYNNDFFTSVILKAKRRIIIYGKRNTRVFKQENILKLFDLAKKKSFHVELMFFSPDISDELLEEIRKSVPHPPKSIKEMRKTQIEYKEEYLQQKKKQNCDNIIYYESLDFPLFQFVLVDNKLYLGIVNYNKEDEENLVYDNRPYLEFNVTDKFACEILKKYSILVKKCEDSKHCY